MTACIYQSSADERINAVARTATPSPTIDDSDIVNANTYIPAPKEKDSIDDVQRRELENTNQKFRVVPDEFKAIDFKNFTYPTRNMKGIIKLKDGKFDYENFDECDNHFGSLDDFFYIDLKSDGIKQALVILIDVACGCGSCDGGSELFYLYEMHKNKPQLLWRFDSGSAAYGCGLKSLTVKDKKIIIEQFGRCNNSKAPSENGSGNKFEIVDTTQSTFAFRKQKIVREKIEVFFAPVRNVMNYSPLISINE